MTKSLVDQFKAARRANTPLVAISTPDQWATAEAIGAALNGVPKLAWDALRGLHAFNDEPAGIAEIEKIGPAGEIAAKTGNPRAMLDMLQRVGEKTVVFMYNAHRFIDDPVVSTAFGVLRDAFKANKRMLVPLGPTVPLPLELQQDVVALNEPMPDDAALGGVLDELYKGVRGVPPATAEQRGKVIAATRGLSAFLAEQTFAMGMSTQGMDVDSCWERKRAAVNQTNGLKFNTTKETFDDIRGLDQIATFMGALFKGENAPRAVLRIDEIDKQLAGATGGDLSGVSADALGAVLRWTEDEGHTGFVAIGPGGSGKSLVSKAIGGTFGVPTLEADLGAAKGGIVGQSEERIRTLLKVVSGVAGGGRVLLVATCNRMASLPPELRRRMKFGMWYFDLPTAEGREAIWRLYFERYKLGAFAPGLLPQDEGWTGAEIRNCCELASDLSVSVKDAATYIVPIIRSAPEQVRELRDMADGRFLDAAREGVYVAAGGVKGAQRQKRQFAAEEA